MPGSTIKINTFPLSIFERMCIHDSARFVVVFSRSRSLFAATRDGSLIMQHQPKVSYPNLGTQVLIPKKNIKTVGEKFIKTRVRKGSVKGEMFSSTIPRCMYVCYLSHSVSHRPK